MMKLLIGLLTALDLYLLMRLGIESQIASTIVAFFLGTSWCHINKVAHYGRRATDEGGIIESIPDMVDRKIGAAMGMGKA